MAKKHSSAAQQALKDMLEMDIDITVLAGKLRRLHKLNEELGIDNKRVTINVEIKTTVVVPVVIPVIFAPLHRKKWYINPDGTISTEYNKWDRD